MTLDGKRRDAAREGKLDRKSKGGGFEEEKRGVVFWPFGRGLWVDLEKAQSTSV